MHIDFFRAIQGDGVINDDLESKMAKDIEIPFNEILPFLVSRLYVPFSTHSGVISRYVANLFCKSEQRRIASHEEQKHTMRTFQEVADHNPKLMRQLAAAFSLKLMASVPVDAVLQSITRLQSADSEKKRTADLLLNFPVYEREIFHTLLAKPYGILRAPEKESFILGDTPVITRQIVNGVKKLGSGFSKDNTHVLLPLSPQLCLQIGLPLDTVQLKAHEVARINEDQVRFMHRCVYSHEEDSRIQAMVDSFGGSFRYREHAFVTTRLSPQEAVECLIEKLMTQNLGSSSHHEWQSLA